MKEHTIQTLHAREILDSRGNPTVEVEITLDSGSFGRAAVPSGASTGTHEAVELRDGDKSRYLGKGVLTAVANVKGEIAQVLLGKSFTQESLDQTLIALDGTPNKGRLGANAILGVSMAFLRASAACENLPIWQHVHAISGLEEAPLMPVPLMNVMNGGAHAEGSTDIQESMIVPLKAASFAEALRMGAETFHHLKKLLNEKGLATTVGDEGGFAPSIASNEEALSLLEEAIRAAGYTPGEDIAIALDVAASEFFADGQYHLKAENKTLSAEEMISWYAALMGRHPIVSIEDPLHEDDWVGTSEMTLKLGEKVQIVGDDLFVTNVERLERGIKEQAGNAILLKVNQIGSITETIAAVKMAKAAGFGTVMSHRSGETEDATIAHLAVGLACGQIKTGSLSRTDRVAKYNQLLRIAETLPGAVYELPKEWRS